MSRSIPAFLALAMLLGSSRAQAQHVLKGHAAPAVVNQVGPTAGVATTAATTTATQAYPYSYYAAYPGPARGYVGYGPQDHFNYYGRAYGYPYDKWTWPYMTGSYNASLARYYEPPVK